MAVLRAGFARAEITPGRDCSLVGYDFRFAAFGTGNEGVLDPLEARAICLKGDDGDPVLLYSIDLCVLESALAQQLRKRIADATGTDAARVMLACTHTHSGPFPRAADTAEGKPRGRVTTQLESGAEEAERRYTERLETVLIQVGRRAAGLLEPAEARHTEFLCEFGYNRRVPDGDGVRLSWNRHESPFPAPARLPDPTVSAVVFRQASGRELLLWSAGVHPVTLGKTSNRVSADWPGAAARLLREWRRGCEPLYFHGAGGEAHPWLATQDRAEALETMGRAVAGPMAAAVAAAHPLEGRPVCGEAALPGFAGGPPISCLRIGRAALVFLPLELFGALGRRIRAAFSDPVFFATVSNGWEGYWPDAAAFAQGGYEVEAALSRGRAADDGERLAGAVDALLRRMGHR